MLPKREADPVHLRDMGVIQTDSAVVPPRAEGHTLAELYIRHLPAAVALATLLTGDRATGEDIAQEGFIRAVGRFEHLRDPSVFAAYLRTTVVNLCRARFRRLRIEREAYARERSPGAAPAPYDPAERDEVWSAIQRLPFRQRAAVVLRYYEDLSEEQAAATLRCSARAVNALISRAMATLRRELAEEEP
jgi:RNA polymerase sigma-70 factor (sigma-E family)